MKILDATIPLEKIPNPIPRFRRKRMEYVEIVTKVLSLPDGIALQVQCETLKELNTIRQALKNRRSMKNVPISCSQDGNVLFCFKKAIEVEEADSPADLREKEVSAMHCPVCGYYCLGHGGNGCIDKPGLLKRIQEKLEVEP